MGNDYEFFFFVFIVIFLCGGGEGFFGVEYEVFEKFGDVAVNDVLGIVIGVIGVVVLMFICVVLILIFFLC